MRHICSSPPPSSGFGYATGKETSKWQNPVTLGKVTLTQENPLSILYSQSTVEAWNITHHSFIRSLNKKGMSFTFLQQRSGLRRACGLKALTNCTSTVIFQISIVGFQTTEKDLSWKFHFCSINIPAESCSSEGRGRGKEGRKVQAREEVEQEDRIPLASESQLRPIMLTSTLHCCIPYCFLKGLTSC